MCPYPTPREIDAIYRARAEQVDRLSRQESISATDIQALTRHGRFQVADEHWEKCDRNAQHALLNDEHAHVRSAATLRSAKSTPRAELQLAN